MTIEATVGYRVIIRDFSVSGALPEDTIKNMITDPLPDGVVAEARQEATFYRLDKSYVGAPGNYLNAFTPIAGPGIWRKINYSYGLGRYQDTRVTTPAALAAGNPVAFLTGAAMAFSVADPASIDQLTASLEIAPGATPGGSVLIELQAQWAGGAWNTVDSRTVGVLEATERECVTLCAVGDMFRNTNVNGNLVFRILCTAATQDCIANNAHLTVLEFLRAQP